jgi:hypothetical protein
MRLIAPSLIVIPSRAAESGSLTRGLFVSGWESCGVEGTAVFPFWECC